MSRLDSFIEKRCSGISRDVRYRPIIDRAKAAAQCPGATTESVLQASVCAARDQFGAASTDEIRLAALKGAMAARVEKPFGLSDLPEGKDKSEHFLMSALIGTEISKAFKHVMPSAWAVWCGEQTSKAVGVAKECLDLITHQDFSRADIQADFKGAKVGPRLSVNAPPSRFKVTP